MKQTSKEANYLTLNTLLKEAKNSSGKDFIQLVITTINLLEKESSLGQIQKIGNLARLSSNGKAIIVGDIHGDLESLLFILSRTRFLARAKAGEKIFMIFLGDYVDRGPNSPEVLYVVLKLKKTFPQNVLLLRGNHEAPKNILAFPNDLPNQLAEKFGASDGLKSYEQLLQLFEFLYSAVLIDKQAILIHGGLPSQAFTIEELGYAHKKHPENTTLAEMLWNDPKEKLIGTRPSPRRIGKLFGEDVTERLLKALDVNVLIRGHESCSGYKLNHNGKVLTLFSTNKEPYTNEFCAYLQLDLSSKIENGIKITKFIKKFKCD